MTVVYLRFALYMFFALSIATIAVYAARVPDGAVIHQSGSTNTQPFTIKLWSDGRAQVLVGDAAPRATNVSQSSAEAFFRDVRAARANPGEAQSCMKSASFGTRTTVSWHDYTSVDLQCRPLSSAVSTLADDVSSIVEQASVGTVIRRIPNPNYMKRAPIEGPSSPTPKATP